MQNLHICPTLFDSKTIRCRAIFHFSFLSFHAPSLSILLIFNTLRSNFKKMRKLPSLKFGGLVKKEIPLSHNLKIK